MASSKQHDTYAVKSQRVSISDIEQMTTHQLAELLANMSLVLRRLPDVPIIDLERQIEDVEEGKE